MEESKKYKCIINFDNPWRNRWDMFIICLAIYNCFFIPFDIAFSPTFTAHPGYMTLDFLLMAFYLMDIIISFRTSFIHSSGDPMYEWRKIAANYICGGRFFIDCLATFPFEYIGSSVFLKIFGILKLSRVLRISVIISRLNVGEDKKALLKMI